MAWLLADYQSTTLFSLKMSNATSSAAKSLVCPTPYAIKMALLDAAIRTLGLEEGERLFPAVRDLAVAVRLPQQVVVSNCFIRVLDPVRSKGKKGGDDDADQEAEGTGPFKTNITFREYVFLDGPLGLAVKSDESNEWLERCLAQVNSFGKRGCFFQLQHVPTEVEQLPAGYTELTRQPTPGDTFPINGLTQVMDDMGGKATFGNVNTYSSERGARQQRVIVLPYRRRASSKGFTWYEKISE